MTNVGGCCSAKCNSSNINTNAANNTITNDMHSMLDMCSHCQCCC